MKQLVLIGCKVILKSLTVLSIEDFIQLAISSMPTAGIKIMVHLVEEYCTTSVVWVGSD